MVALPRALVLGLPAAATAATPDGHLQGSGLLHPVSEAIGLGNHRSMGAATGGATLAGSAPAAAASPWTVSAPHGRGEMALICGQRLAAAATPTHGLPAAHRIGLAAPAAAAGPVARAAAMLLEVKGPPRATRRCSGSSAHGDFPRTTASTHRMCFERCTARRAAQSVRRSCCGPGGAASGSLSDCLLPMAAAEAPPSGPVVVRHPLQRQRQTASPLHPAAGLLRAAKLSAVGVVAAALAWARGALPASRTEHPAIIQVSRMARAACAAQAWVDLAPPPGLYSRQPHHRRRCRRRLRPLRLEVEAMVHPLDHDQDNEKTNAVLPQSSSEA